MKKGIDMGATVRVMHHPAGINAGCAKCRNIIKSGQYAVAVEVGGHKYLVGHNPPIIHCGEEKKVPLLFQTEAEADQAVQETIAILDRDGDTSGLRLLEVAQFISAASH